MPSAAPPGIGTKLRRARIERSLSIEETAWRTRIRPDLLRALELEQFEDIGQQSFVRTHLHSYARFLGIDATGLVDEFEQAQPEPVPSALEGLDDRVKTSKKPPRAKWLVAALLSGVVLVIAAAVGLLGGQAERPAGDAAQDVRESPIVASASPGAAVPAIEARVNLRVDVTAATELSVLVDGKKFFEGKVVAGDVQSFRAHDTVEIIVAKPDAVTLTLNGTKLAPLGPSGQVARAKFGPNGRID